MNIARKLSQKYFSRFAFARAARNNAQPAIPANRKFLGKSGC